MAHDVLGRRLDNSQRGPELMGYIRKEPVFSLLDFSLQLLLFLLAFNRAHQKDDQQKQTDDDEKVK